MPLQIAILKVLVSLPEGRATIAALNSDLSILTTSGSARTDRLRRLRNRDVGHSALLDDRAGLFRAWAVPPVLSRQTTNAPGDRRTGPLTIRNAASRLPSKKGACF